MWDLTHSLTASGLAAALLILDIGMLVLNRYILLGTAFKPQSVLPKLFSKFLARSLKKSVTGQKIRSHYQYLKTVLPTIHFRGSLDDY